MLQMLEAAMWAPYHGPTPPWRFVVLGKQAMNDMQRLSLAFYDKHWKQTPRFKDTPEPEFTAWRNKTEREIEGRWGPTAYMIAIVVRRQAGKKLMPYWEEAAATACAVQNMHIQVSAIDRSIDRQYRPTDVIDRSAF